jgi:hypothetical protein
MDDEKPADEMNIAGRPKEPHDVLGHIARQIRDTNEARKNDVTRPASVSALDTRDPVYQERAKEQGYKPPGP